MTNRLANQRTPIAANLAITLRYPQLYLHGPLILKLSIMRYANAEQVSISLDNNREGNSAKEAHSAGGSADITGFCYLEPDSRGYKELMKPSTGA